MSCAPVETPSTAVQLIRAVVCGGYFPGMRQPALSAEFAVVTGGAGDAPVARITEIIATFIPDFTFRELQGEERCAPILALVASVYEELMKKAGLPLLSSSRVVGVDSSQGRIHLYLPLLDHSVYGPCVDALRWAVKLVEVLRVKGEVNALSPGLARVLQQLASVAPSGMNSLRFIEEADRLGIPWRRVAANVYRFGFGSRSRLLDSSFTDSTSFIGARLARDKRLTAQVLNDAGLPGARHEQAFDADDAVRIAERLGYPVVVKPADAEGGRGVMPGLANADRVRKAFAQASAVSSLVLVEKHAEGNDYRLQVLHDEVYWIVNRVPGGVTGDGIHTVEELLAEVNAHPLRGPRESNSLLKIIELDEEALALLEEAKLQPKSIPEEGRFVRLRRASNVASGGIPVPALEGAHPDNMELAVRAAKLLRLDVAGIDLIIPDIRRSWLDSGALICEVNAQPQLFPHLPAYLLERLVKGNGRVPVVVVLGGAPSWVMDAAMALNDRGCRVGVLWTDGIHVNGRRVMGPPASTYLGCEALLSDSRVDCAILCLEDDHLMKSGFPIDRFDRLVLVEPREERDTQQWAQLHAMVGFLADICVGDILIDVEAKGWGPILEGWLPGRVKHMPERDFLSGLDGLGPEGV